MPYRSKERCGESDNIFFVISDFYRGHCATDSKKGLDITPKKKNIFPHRTDVFWEEIRPKNWPKR